MTVQEIFNAKKMWAVLNGSLDDYIFLYSEDGIDSFDISGNDTKNEYCFLRV